MLWLAIPALLLLQTPDLVLEGPLPDDGDDFFDLDFEVPAGTAELEIHQGALDDADVLDFSLHAPDGTFRGEGGGRIDIALINEDAATRSYLPGPLTSGTWTVSVGKATLASATPTYHVEVFFRDTATLAPLGDRAPYVEEGALDGEARFYAGDFHVHSEDSNDARPPLDEIRDFARGRGLDFVVITDHNTTAHIGRLSPAQARVDDATGPFLFVPGVEFTTYGGHATGFGATEPVEWRIGHDGHTLDDALDAFAAQGALFSINHPSLDIGELCIGCAWQHDAPAVGALQGVEIETGGYRQAGFLFFDDALFFWEALLDAGHRVAALGGSDDHQAGTSDGSPIGDPTTLVFSSSLSVPALRQAILDSRTVVKLQGPDDPMIALDATPPRGGKNLAGVVRGDTVAHHDVVTVSARVTGAAGLQLWWVVDGAYQDVRDIGSDDETLTLEVAPPDDGAIRVRAQVDEGDTPRTVASYLWIERGAPPAAEPSCGCDVTAATTGGTNAVPLAVCVVLIASVTRRRSARTPAAPAR